MNAAQAHAKARAAMKRREDEIEAEELEAGEINLVPYLDIVTVLMLFMLMGLSAGFVLGQINTTLPDHVAANSTNTQKPQTPPDEQPLQLVVSATKDQLILWSLSGLEGSLKEPRATFKKLQERTQGGAPIYDYDSLNNELYKIASTRWGGKFRKRDTYEIILQADGDVPYETVISMMDAMRRKLPETGDAEPAKYPELEPEDPAKPGKKREFVQYKYNPDENPLFNDILFSMGFE